MLDTNQNDATEIALHPRRTPLHNDTAKGQTWFGTCNTHGCNCVGSIHWNALDFAFYCLDCAGRINATDTPACEAVSERPDLAQMNQRWRYAVKAYR